MKRLIPTILAVVSLSTTISAQVIQEGIIQEYNEAAKKTPLAGVELNIRSAGSTVSDNGGHFSLEFMTLKPGEKVNVRRIEKLGYEIFNKEAVEQWNINPNNPFVIVMCRSDKFKKIRDNYERVSSESYAQQLKKEEEALAKLKSDGEIQEAEYQKELLALHNNYENQLDNLQNYIDRFSRIDLSELSAIEQEIITLVQQGRMDEAIAMYEKQDYLDKYKKDVAQLKEISSAIDQLSDIKKTKEQSRDSLLVSIYRQIETLQLAGGKNNFEKISVLYHDIAFADTTNADLMLKYAEFCNTQNQIDEGISLIQNLLSQELSNSQHFWALSLLANMKQRNGDFSAALDLFIKCDSVASVLSSPDVKAIASHNIGTSYLDAGCYDDALQYFISAKDIREMLLKDGNNTDTEYQLSTTYANIARVFECKKDLVTAQKYFSKALEIQEKLYQIDSFKYGNSIANTYNSIAVISHEIRDYHEAEKYYLKAINILSEKYEKDPQRYAMVCGNVYGNYASLIIDMMKPDESLKYHLKAIEAYNEIKASAPLAVMRQLAMEKLNIANVYVHKQLFDKALVELDDALSIFEDLALLETKDYATEICTLCSNYALILIEMHRPDEAEAKYMKAYSICKRKDGDLSYIMTKGKTCFAIGNFYSVYKNNQILARKFFEESNNIFSVYVKAIPQLNAYIANNLNGIAYSYVFTKEFDTALDYIEHAIETMPNDINLFDSKCEILFMSGRSTEATELLQTISEKFPNTDISTLPSYNLINKNAE